MKPFYKGLKVPFSIYFDKYSHPINIFPNKSRDTLNCYILQGKLTNFPFWQIKPLNLPIDEEKVINFYTWEYRGSYFLLFIFGNKLEVYETQDFQNYVLKISIGGIALSVCSVFKYQERIVVAGFRPENSIGSLIFIPLDAYRYFYNPVLQPIWGAKYINRIILGYYSGETFVINWGRPFKYDEFNPNDYFAIALGSDEFVSDLVETAGFLFIFTNKSVYRADGIPPLRVIKIADIGGVQASGFGQDIIWISNSKDIYHYNVAQEKINMISYPIGEEKEKLSYFSYMNVLSSNITEERWNIEIGQIFNNKIYPVRRPTDYKMADFIPCENYITHLIYRWQLSDVPSFIIKEGGVEKTYYVGLHFYFRIGGNYKVYNGENRKYYTNIPFLPSRLTFQENSVGFATISFDPNQGEIPVSRILDFRLGIGTIKDDKLILLAYSKEKKRIVTSSNIPIEDVFLDEFDCNDNFEITEEYKAIFPDKHISLLNFCDKDGITTYVIMLLIHFPEVIDWVSFKITTKNLENTFENKYYKSCKLGILNIILDNHFFPSFRLLGRELREIKLKYNSLISLKNNFYWANFYVWADLLNFPMPDYFSTQAFEKIFLNHKLLEITATIKWQNRHKTEVARMYGNVFNTQNLFYHRYYISEEQINPYIDAEGLVFEAIPPAVWGIYKDENQEFTKFFIVGIITFNMLRIQLINFNIHRIIPTSWGFHIPLSEGKEYLVWDTQGFWKYRPYENQKTFLQNLENVLFCINPKNLELKIGNIIYDDSMEVQEAVYETGLIDLPSLGEADLLPILKGYKLEISSYPNRNGECKVEILAENREVLDSNIFAWNSTEIGRFLYNIPIDFKDYPRRFSVRFTFKYCYLVNFELYYIMKSKFNV